MEVHFLGGPLDGTTQQMPSPLPTAWNVAELVEIDEWTGNASGDVRDRVTTYLRRAAEFAGRRYTVFVAPGVDVTGWRPVTHRCTNCGSSVRVRLVPATTGEDRRRGRCTMVWGRHDPCDACGSIVPPTRVEGWGDVVTWTVR